jgi:hypothetical protein
MNLSEAQLQLLGPAILFMDFIERKYRDVEEHRASLEQVLPMIRCANTQIEALIAPDALRHLQLSNADDRYRMKHFLNE